MPLPFFKNRGDKTEMSFIDHLEELRWHITRSLLAIIIGAIVAFINIDWIYDHIITGPLQKDFWSYTALCEFGHWLKIGDSLCLPPPTNQELQTTAFGSMFMVSITSSFVIGFIMAFPYIFWEFWKFLKPALSPKELRSTRGAIFWVTLFFFMGTAFGYYLLAPFTFSFLSNYKIGTTQILIARPTLSDYMENLVDIIIGSALAFQLPVVSFVLTKIGIVTPKFLSNYRKYAYVVILIVSAIITPSPDWMSQMIVFIPLAILYELSIFISKYAHRGLEKKRKEWEDS